MHDRAVNYKEAIISILLGLPDGITYLVFGFGAGDILASQLGASGWAHSLIVHAVALGAALGVAFFAINNVSREYSSVFKATLGDCYDKNHPHVRKVLRLLCLIIALFSAIPFAGMAMTASTKLQLGGALSILLVVSNAIARTAMNDYALTHILTHVFNRALLWVRTLSKQDAATRVRIRYLQALLNFEDKARSCSHAEIMALRRKLFKNPLFLTAANPRDNGASNAGQRYPLIGLLGFAAGAFTGTYIYGFAVKATTFMLGMLGIHSVHAIHFIALCGVIPTSFLWGNETMITLTAIYKFITRSLSRLKQKQFFWYNNEAQPLRYNRLIKVLLITFFAAAGAFSEVKMAYTAVNGYAFSRSDFLQHYANFIIFFAPLAFASIYSVCVVELVDKMYALIAQRRFFGHVYTLQNEVIDFSGYSATFVLEISDAELLKLADASVNCHHD